MTLNQPLSGDYQIVSPPVFDGLESLGLNGKDIAEITRVSPPTVSKWRNGRVAVPSEVVALLTLILASTVEDIVEQNDGGQFWQKSWSFHQRAGLQAAREALEAQEIINQILPPSAVRTGAIRYRYWWNVQMRKPQNTVSLMELGATQQPVSAF